MTVQQQKPERADLKPRISVFGVGGGGGNAVNNMINAGLQGVEFVAANTDAQALEVSKAETRIQLGLNVTDGLGAGSHPEIGCEAAKECIDEINEHLGNAHMVFVTAGMGGGTGTGAAPVIARAAREKGILTVGVVTKPFHFEGQRRMKTAEAGIEELQENVDTLIVIPNQNLFRIANEQTTFADAFSMADQVLYSGVASVTDLMMREGLVNLDFADVRSVMQKMGKAMMGTGEASDKGRALAAAEAAIANPLLDETSMRGARGLLISITGGRDMTLHEVDEAANRISAEVDKDANIIFGAIIDEALEGVIRVSVVATGIDSANADLDSAYEPQPVTISSPAASANAGFKKASTGADNEEEFEGDVDGSDGDDEEEINAEAAASEKVSEPKTQPRPFTNAPRPNPAPISGAPGLAEGRKPVNAAAQGGYVRPPRTDDAVRTALGAEPRPGAVHQQRFSGEQGEERGISGITDFPVDLRKTLSRQDRPREEGGVRSMWNKLKNALGASEEAEARLEPRNDIAERGNQASQFRSRNDAGSEPGQSRRVMNNVRPAPIRRPNTVYNDAQGNGAARYNARPEEREEDRLEIPSFLRRQNR